MIAAVWFVEMLLEDEERKRSVEKMIYMNSIISLEGKEEEMQYQERNLVIVVLLPSRAKSVWSSW